MRRPGGAGPAVGHGQRHSGCRRGRGAETSRGHGAVGRAPRRAPRAFTHPPTSSASPSCPFPVLLLVFRSPRGRHPDTGLAGTGAVAEDLDAPDRSAQRPALPALSCSTRRIAPLRDNISSFFLLLSDRLGPWHYSVRFT